LNSMNSMAAPAVTGNTDLDRVFAWIALATDPNACGARLAEIVLAHTSAAEVIRSADEIKAGIAKEREALKAERKMQEGQLASERAAFESACHARDQAINQRAAETARLNEDAKAARTAAEQIRIDAQRRVEQVKAAAVALSQN
jgi:hypothetical protein